MRVMPIGWLLVLAAAAGAADRADQSARVRITQRDLIAQCLNHHPATGSRAWSVPPGPVSLAFTMRSQSRPGVAAADPGTASIAFTAETGRQYEVEVRADPMAFSSRNWRRREWRPVVRDRTTDQIVSSEPEWVEPGCR